MTSVQKIIKYLAIALAVFIIIMIATAVLKIIIGITSITRIWGWVNNKEQAQEIISTNFENADISILDIEIAYTDLIIKTGKTFKVESSSKDIISKQENREIKIKEKNKNWFSKDGKQKLVIYIPEFSELKKVKIEAGAGKINIEKLITENLVFELGAGETKIENLNVLKECEIKGGAGKVNIKSGTINNLDLDLGIGETIVTSTLTGKNEINAGVGNLDINLNGEKEEYQITANKGLGAIKIDGQEMTTGQVIGNGANRIKVDGGIGNIDIQFEEVAKL